MVLEEFKNYLDQKAEELYRPMPWREDTRAYYVLVSELMLQQTQVVRVIPKFEAFIATFPDEKTLAKASLADVLKLWQGLGYNRRARFLHEAAKMIVNDFDGVFPNTFEKLVRLPGVGKNTAGAILAYSYNQPAIYVETNIRTVYIHHFFADGSDIDDKQIIKLLSATLDQENPRRFYQNLMDYGTWLKSQGIRNISSSKHYKKQSPLTGSLREVRGLIIKYLTSREMSEVDLIDLLPNDKRAKKALNELLKEGLIQRTSNVIHLTK